MAHKDVYIMIAAGVNCSSDQMPELVSGHRRKRPQFLHHKAAQSVSFLFSTFLQTRRKGEWNTWNELLTI